MTRILLAVLAGLGVLAAGCTTTGSTDASGTAAPVAASDLPADVESRASAAAAAGCTEIAPDGSCMATSRPILRLGQLRPGQQAWFYEAWYPTVDNGRSGCRLQFEAFADSITTDPGPEPGQQFRAYAVRRQNATHWTVTGDIKYDGHEATVVFAGKGPKDEPYYAGECPGPQ